MKKWFAILVALAIVFACATNLYSDDYTVVQGKLRAIPIADGDNKRLTFYIDASDGQTYIAIAENKENFDILRTLVNQIGHNEATVYLFCQEADKEWHEYVDSVDYEVFGVGYYDFYAQRYVTVITTYGSRFTDVLRSADWGTFTSSLLKKGIGAAL
jgi:hypothetical protein